MKLTEAKQQFISNWGAFGTHWGINRTMAQIHALLLISPDPLTQDDIMEELNISRGNEIPSKSQMHQNKKLKQ